MSRDLVWTERALKDANRLHPEVRERIVTALDRLVTSDHGDVRQLSGTQWEWR